MRERMKEMLGNIRELRDDIDSLLDDADIDSASEDEKRALNTLENLFGMLNDAAIDISNL